ncbi:MAG: TonB-dependent receptor [Gammaproteobacteria bacterium]
MNRARLAISVAASACCSLGFAASAVAAADDASGQLEEVVVTATKRSESLQNVSVAVSAVSGDLIRELQVSDVSSLQKLIPSLTAGEDTDIAKIFIRGVGLNTSATLAEAGVAVYVDGAVISRPEAQLTSFFDLERAEVLRGPQGTLYGRNAVGGAINLISAKPTKQLAGYVGLTYGNYDQQIAEGAVSGPITSTLSARLAGRSESHSGYGRFIATGQDVDDNDRQMARAQLMWEPNDTFNWLLQLETFHQNDNSGSTHKGALAFPGTAFVLTGIGGYATNPRDTAGDAIPFLGRSTWSATSTLSLKANDWLSFVDLTNYREFDEEQSIDYDLSNVNNLTTGRPFSTDLKFADSRQFSNELQMHVTNDWVKGVLGLFYFHEDLGSQNYYGGVNNSLFGPDSFIDGMQAAGLDPVAAWAACGRAGTAFSPQRPDGRPNPLVNFCTASEHQTKVYAAFGQVLFNLGSFASALEGVTLKVGGRYNEETRSVYNPGAFASPGGAAIFVPGVGSRKFTRFTPEGGLQWKPNAAALLYYTYSEGFKSGVGEPFSPGTNRIIDPEFIQNHEIGLKLTLLENRATLNIAAFKYKMQGLQIQKTAPISVGGDLVPVQLFENAAGVSAHGAEVELAARPIPQLRLNVSAAWLVSRFTDFETIDPLDPRNILGPTDYQFVAPVESLDGFTTRNSPKLTASLGGEFDITGLHLPNSGILTPRVDVFYRSDTYYSEFQRLSEGQAAFTLVDASVRYHTPESKVWGSLWIKNATDKLAVSGSYPHNFHGFLGVSYFPPRTYGASIGYSF